MTQIIFPSFFTPRLTKYNLRGTGLNEEQPPYNSLVIYNIQFTPALIFNFIFAF